MTERDIFVAALHERDPDGRAAYLDRACENDPGLRQRVESLLREQEQLGSFLETPAVRRAAEGHAGPTSAEDMPAESAGGSADGPTFDFLESAENPNALGRLGHYEVLELIGRGGMGIVLRAFDERLRRVVAIKVLAPELATSGTARRRFTREAQAQAAVSHDHIVTIHAVEEANGLPYLVMQFIDGLSLQERLDKTGPLQLHEILRIGMQTASGLAAAHAQGLIHRDIKPANILLENGVERVKITDFGLARAVTDANLTQSGLVAGTPQYMAPEQASADTLDARTDLFSLGSVLYAMCAGRPPFRGSNSMAVLKRVCEETPAPIREVNAEIPDWLVAIIDKLHAKDPAERYQSAAEVAQLLSEHLAHVQHPSVATSPLSPRGRGAGGEGRSRAPHRRRLAVAAAVLLCFVAGLSFTEATGVTNLRATVIRIFTPDGTLVVETDDPAVKVTIEGDGGLVITGAGPHEVRLKPGSYKLQADKNGKPVRLDQEVVTITRGDKQVVKVRLERPAVAAGAAAEKGAFVLLSAGKERKFDTLAEAVLGASSGETIEIRGDGPFLTGTIHVGNQSLTIRAGEGFRPVIKSSPATEPQPASFLRTDASLVLEGLHLERPIEVCGSSLYVANCQLITMGDYAKGYTSPKCEFRNCELFTAELATVRWYHADGGQFVLDNCVVLGGGAIRCSHRPNQRNVSVRLSRNTLIGKTVVTFARSDVNAIAKDFDPLQLNVSNNIIASPAFFWLFGKTGFLTPEESSSLLADLPTMIGWRGEGNLYANGHRFFERHSKTFAEWNRIWNHADAGSRQGEVRFEGGNLAARMAVAPEKLTPQDFRLRPDSAGYRSGKDKKDLGAEVDLVGPGPAYERWKKMPEYQQWLKDTGQKK